MSKAHRSDSRVEPRQDVNDEDVDVDALDDDVDGREFTPWRWVLGGVLVVALLAVVVFAIKQSNAEKRAELAERERARLEAEAPGGARRPGGDVNYILFCADARPGPHGLDIRGALDQVAVPAFPTKMSFSVVASVTPDRAGRRYELARCDEAGKVQFSQELKLQGGTSVASVNVMTVKDLDVREPTDVPFRVFRDGTLVAERVLRIGPQMAPVQSNQAVGGP